MKIKENKYILDAFQCVETRVSEIKEEFISRLRSGEKIDGIGLSTGTCDVYLPGAEDFLIERYGPKVYKESLAGIGDVEKLKILSKEEIESITEKKTYEQKLKKTT